MPNYQIIATDLDGTLLNSRMELTRENLEAIHTLTKRGVHVVAATGRAWEEVDPRIRENPDIRYYITSGGAMTYDKLTGQQYTTCIPADLAGQVQDVLEAHRGTWCLHYAGGSYMQRDVIENGMADYAAHPYMKHFLSTFDTPVEDLSAFSRGKDVEMFCTFYPTIALRDACKAKIDAMGQFITASSVPENLEIFHHTSGKGNALLALADRLGIPHAATIAVGDSTNDYTMIHDAGLGLAVDNAFDELKAAADRVICHCDDHIMRYILNNIIR